MDQILSKVWNSRYGKYLLPLSFCVGNLINVMFYYLGLAFQDNIARQTGFVIGNVLFASAAFLALLLAALIFRYVSRMTQMWITFVGVENPVVNIIVASVIHTLKWQEDISHNLKVQLWPT